MTEAQSFQNQAYDIIMRLGTDQQRLETKLRVAEVLGWHGQSAAAQQEPVRVLKAADK